MNNNIPTIFLDTQDKEEVFEYLNSNREGQENAQKGEVTMRYQQDNNPPTTSLAIILNKENLSHGDIQEILELIDEKTGNIAYRMAAEYFGFKIAEVDGKVVSTAKELARALDYKDVSNILRHLQDNSLEPLDISGFDRKSQIKLREIFSLSPNDRKTKFLDWKCFVLVGWKSKKVREYLLIAEKQNRINTATYHTTGLDAHDLAQYARYADKDPQVKYYLQMMQLSKGMANLRIAQLDQQEEIDMLKQSITEHKKIEDNLRSQLDISIEAGKKLAETFVDVSVIPASNKSRAKIHRAITHCIYSEIKHVVGWEPPEAKYVYIRVKRSDFRKLLCDQMNIRMMKQLDERDVEEALIFLKYMAMTDEDKNSSKTKAMLDRMYLLWTQRERRQAKAHEAEIGQNPRINEILWRMAVKNVQAEFKEIQNGK